MKSIMTVRIDPEAKKRLDRMARATARTKSFLVADAINEYLSINEWQIEAIREGLRQAEEGQFISHEEVKKKWEATVEDTMD